MIMIKYLNNINIIAIFAIITFTSCGISPSSISEDKATDILWDYVNSEIKKRTNLYYGELIPYSKTDNQIIFSLDYKNKAVLDNNRWILTMHLTEGPTMCAMGKDLIVRASVNKYGEEPRIDKCESLHP
jgi:hypothetical protein